MTWQEQEREEVLGMVVVTCVLALVAGMTHLVVLYMLTGIMGVWTGVALLVHHLTFTNRPRRGDTEHSEGSCWKG